MPALLFFVQAFKTLLSKPEDDRMLHAALAHQEGHLLDVLGGCHDFIHPAYRVAAGGWGRLYVGSISHPYSLKFATRRGCGKAAFDTLSSAAKKANAGLGESNWQLLEEYYNAVSQGNGAAVGEGEQAGEVDVMRGPAAAHDARNADGQGHGAGRHDEHRCENDGGDQPDNGVEGVFAVAIVEAITEATENKERGETTRPAVGLPFDNWKSCVDPSGRFYDSYRQAADMSNRRMQQQEQEQEQQQQQQQQWLKEKQVKGLVSDPDSGWFPVKVIKLAAKGTPLTEDVIGKTRPVVINGLFYKTVEEAKKGLEQEGLQWSVVQKNIEDHIWGYWFALEL